MEKERVSNCWKQKTRTFLGIAKMFLLTPEFLVNCPRKILLENRWLEFGHWRGLLLVRLEYINFSNNTLQTCDTERKVFTFILSNQCPKYRKCCVHVISSSL
mmetsp:Transcript_18867/g.27911  ORF Transcript_18867/g.27911 Transcript_18867/m.27911 type:complete len:102 (+) Transcript_18867:1592-1897(+)